MNASYNERLTNGLREIISDISEYLLREGVGIVVLDDFQWFIETLTLMAKQVNLCDGCIALLENGMEQEAYILARSQFNNLLWIKYLLSDTDGSHLKEYIYQPDISQRLVDKNLLKILDEFDDINEKIKEPELRELVEQRIRNTEALIEEKGLSKKTKSIAELAKTEEALFSMYVTFYHKASKFEHSDISANQLLRKQILKEYSRDHIFKLDASVSDKDCWYEVYHFSFMSLFYAYEAIERIITSDMRYLLEDTPYTKAAYNEECLKNICIKFYRIQKILESDRQNK